MCKVSESGDNSIIVYEDAKTKKWKDGEGEKGWPLSTHLHTHRYGHIFEFCY